MPVTSCVFSLITSQATDSLYDYRGDEFGSAKGAIEFATEMAGFLSHSLQVEVGGLVRRGEKSRRDNRLSEKKSPRQGVLPPSATVCYATRLGIYRSSGR